MWFLNPDPEPFFLNPRSFDFHQSWPEYDNEDASAVDLVQQQPSPWQVRDPKASMSPAPLPPPASSELSNPLAAAPPPPPLPPPPAAQVVVVHSACCRHSGSERAADSSSGGARSRATDVKSKRKSSKVKKVSVNIALHEISLHWEGQAKFITDIT